MLDLTCHHQLITLNTFANHFTSLLLSFDLLRQQSILRAKEYNLSSCLTVTPIEKDQFDLSAQDGLTLCHMRPLLSLPHCCDGCGAPFTVTHALDCHVGGLVICKHNEVCDAFRSLASLVWSPVQLKLLFGSLLMSFGVQRLLIFAFEVFGSSSVRPYLISELWTLMHLHTVIGPLILFCVQQCLKKRGSI